MVNLFFYRSGDLKLWNNNDDWQRTSVM